MGFFHEYTPLLIMILVQFGYAGLNITSKGAMYSGVTPGVIITYHQVLVTIVMAPFAFFQERNIRPRMTKGAIRDIFTCSIFGGTLSQYLYFLGLNYSTPTMACAIINMLPAITFILAVLFRVEKVDIKKTAGQAKVVGTIVCVGGAVLLSFCGDGPKGPVLVISSCFSWAVSFIIQARLSKKYQAPLSSTALMCLMSSFQCAVVAVLWDYSASSWLLEYSDYPGGLWAGMVASALAYCMMTWAFAEKGTLYVSAFSPLLLFIVAIVCWGVPFEEIYPGIVVAPILIVAGLYILLWGKKKEIAETKVENLETDTSVSNLEIKTGDTVMPVDDEIA